MIILGWFGTVTAGSPKHLTKSKFHAGRSGIVTSTFLVFSF